MKNKIERLLISLLLGISVLLGLTFWLNTIFGFNLFFKEHWDTLAKLQTEHIAISSGFYISIGVAIFIFVFGLCFIYVPVIKSAYKKAATKTPSVPTQPAIPTQNASAPVSQQTISKQPDSNADIQTTEQIPIPIPQNTNIPASRPPRLNLPSNMAQIVAQQAASQNQPESMSPKDLHKQFDPVLAQMFAEGGYVVKPNPIIAGFTPNLFAIAPNEIVWMGAINADINKLQMAIDKLQSVFRETLESIPIHVNTFLLDTTNQQTSSDSIHVVHSMDELKAFVSELPPAWPKDADEDTKDNFDSYSEYIDTMIQYIKTMR